MKQKFCEKRVDLKYNDLDTYGQLIFVTVSSL